MQNENVESAEEKLDESTDNKMADEEENGEHKDEQNDDGNGNGNGNENDNDIEVTWAISDDPNFEIFDRFIKTNYPNKKDKTMNNEIIQRTLTTLRHICQDADKYYSDPCCAVFWNLYQRMYTDYCADEYKVGSYLRTLFNHPICRQLNLIQHNGNVFQMNTLCCLTMLKLILDLDGSSVAIKQFITKHKHCILIWHSLYLFIIHGLHRSQIAKNENTEFDIGSLQELNAWIDTLRTLPKTEYTKKSLQYFYFTALNAFNYNHPALLFGIQTYRTCKYNTRCNSNPNTATTAILECLMNTFHPEYIDTETVSDVNESNLFSIWSALTYSAPERVRIESNNNPNTNHNNANSSVARSRFISDDDSSTNS